MLEAINKIIPLNKDVTMIALGGIDSNVYLIKKTLLVDATTGWHKEKLLEALKKLGVKPEKIRTVVHTHCHFDHVGGNWIFPKAKIAIGVADAAVLEKRDFKKSYAIFFGGLMRKIRAAQIKLADGEALRVGNLKLQAIGTPGHTEGSICLYEQKTRTLFSGDTVFADATGRTDLIGGSDRSLRKSLEKLSGFDIEAILPGHGKILMRRGTQHILSLLEQMQGL